MKEPFSDEILSAYLDGELSPRERGEVESWLETSPAAREKLDDFRRLSSLFDSLPRAELPQVFPTSVMQLAERRMLLPEARDVSSRWRVGRWVFSVGAPLASAAILFVIVSLMLRDRAAPGIAQPGIAERDILERAKEPQAAPGQPLSQNRLRPLPDGFQDQPRDESGEKSATVARRDSIRDQVERPPHSKSADEPQLAGAASAPAGGGAGGGAAPSSPEASQEMRVAKKSMASRMMAPTPGAPLADEAANVPELAQFNQTIHDLQERDNSQELVSVVKLYVADRAAGMLLLQNILAENEIVSDSGAKPGASGAAGITRKSAAREQAAGKQPAQKHADGEQADGEQADGEQAEGAVENEALYVVAELDQLTAAFTAMLSREHPGVRMAVEEPIEIAALDADVQEQLQEIAPSFAGNRAMRRALGSDESARFDKAEAPADGKPAGDYAPAPDAAKGAAKSGAKPDEKSDQRAPAGPPAEKRIRASRAPDAGKPSAQLGKKDRAGDDRPTDVADKPGADQPPGSLGGGRGGKQDPANQDVTGRDLAGRGLAGQGIAGHSRQLVVPMPEAIRRRMEAGDVKLRSERDADAPDKAAAPVADDEVRRHEKAKKAPTKPETAKTESLNAAAEERDGGGAEKDGVESETAQREPLLVKLLIVVEHEPGPAREAAPSAKKRAE